MTMIRRRSDADLRTAIDHAASFHEFPHQQGSGHADHGSLNDERPGEPQKRRNQLRLLPPSAWTWQGAQLDMVEGIMGRGMFVLLYGASGSSKTLIGVDLGMHIAHGRSWHGRQTKPGFVVYLAPEGGHSVHLRLLAWAQHHGINLADDLSFRTIPMRIDLCHEDQDVEAIIANIQAASEKLGPCCLIEIDTVSRALAGGDENGPRDMGAFVARCDRLREATGASVLATHHTPKDGNLPRGHGSLMNAADIRLHAEKVADGLFSLELAHLKDGRAGDILTFQLETEVVGANEEGNEVKGALVVPGEVRPAGQAGRPRTGTLSARQSSLMQTLHAECLSTKRWTISFAEFSNLAVKSGAIGADHPSKRQRVSDLRQQLAAKGLIAVDGCAETVTYLNTDLFAQG